MNLAYIITRKRHVPNSKCGIFLSCLHFAVLNSLHSEVILKPKQVICLEKIFLNMDILATLPTGYGESLIFCLIPALIFAKKNGVKCSRRISTIVIVVSPLNALIENQISRLCDSGIRATALDVKSCRQDDNDESEDESLCDFSMSDKEKLETGCYYIVFAHPESLVSCVYGRKLMRTKPYQNNVCAIVVDEAHCILDW